MKRGSRGSRGKLSNTIRRAQAQLSQKHGAERGAEILQAALDNARIEAVSETLGERAGDIRAQRAELRAKHNLCLHLDDERSYRNAQERAEDKKPAALCDIPGCGKRRLIVRVTPEAEPRGSGPFLKATVADLMKITR